MTDPDSAPGRLRNLFGMLRKPEAETPEPIARGTPPQVMRLRVAQFEERRVVDVMVPRAEIMAVEAGIEFPDLLRYFAEVTHSRLPVYRETLDDPIGFIHIKDVVSEIAKGGPLTGRPLERLRREMLYVPPSMKLADLLVKMQASRIHLALVVDEYGGTGGLITLENLVEVIVGDIEDEHDDLEPMFVRRGARVWEADARTDVIKFAEQTGVDLRLPETDADVDTLGGIALALAGRFPERGERLSHPGGAELEIIEADPRRILRMRLHLPERSPSPPAEESRA